MKQSLYDLFQNKKTNSINLNKVEVTTKLQTELVNFKIKEESSLIYKPPLKIIQKQQQSTDRYNMVNRFEVNKAEKKNIQTQKNTQNNPKRSRPKSLEAQQIIYQNIEGKNQNIFKPFLRITDLLNQQQVRSLQVLKIAFKEIKNIEQTNPELCFEQLQSLRQDLHVQNLHNQFVIEVLEFSILFSLKNKKIPQMCKCIGQLKLICKQLHMKINPQFISYQIYYLILNNLFVELQTLLMILQPDILLNQQVKKALNLYSLITVKNYPKIYQIYCNSTSIQKYIFQFYEDALNLQNLQRICKSINKDQSIYQEEAKEIWASLLNNADYETVSRYLSEIH